ncbi:hypothetical protein TRFO_33420 [Tritrichomonas foetus]|uniref:SUN domain-containing protein n=1 Tax=Tritrichomonas foetus TaxID=1144522 RepID=A0A1J4JMT0_9EUKA|nr:hypothetical protein TRFO_33420 [Tritrichomonas foetus]|eukprot:OHT00002.1 hypothetical protein TRFO_33420 [Tritrichomonas foetus]
MILLLLTFAFCDQYDQAKEIKKDINGINDQLKSIKTDTDKLKSALPNLSQKMNHILKNLEEIKKQENEFKNSLPQINQQLSNYADDILSKTVPSLFKQHPVNISLVKFTSDVEKKSIDTIPYLMAKFFANYQSPSFPKDEKGFWKIQGNSASFTFLASQKSRATKIELHQLRSEKCSPKTIKVTFYEHRKKIFESKIFNVLQHSESPQSFYLNSTVWFKVAQLDVLSNYGDNFVCLPEFRVLDDDYYEP